MERQLHVAELLDDEVPVQRLLEEKKKERFLTLPDV